MIAVPVIGTIALFVTFWFDGSVVFDAVCYVIAVLCTGACVFGDQNRLAFFGRRWSLRGEPELSKAGYQAARLTWVVLAVIIAAIGIVNVTPRM